VEENMGRGDRRGNREAKKPKKLTPKEIAPICFESEDGAWGRHPKKEIRKNSYDDSDDLGASFLIVSRSGRSRATAATYW
jgi:hypothetical protein